MCRSFRSLDRRAWAPAHGDAGLGRQLAGEDLSGRPCPRDPAMLASVVNQVPHCGFPVASLVGFIGTCEIGRASCRESVSVRVNLGGRRIIKKKKKINKNK